MRERETTHVQIQTLTEAADPFLVGVSGAAAGVEGPATGGTGATAFLEAINNISV